MQRVRKLARSSAAWQQLGGVHLALELRADCQAQRPTVATGAELRQHGQSRGQPANAGGHAAEDENVTEHDSGAHNSEARHYDQQQVASYLAHHLLLLTDNRAGALSDCLELADAWAGLKSERRESRWADLADQLAIGVRTAQTVDSLTRPGLHMAACDLLWQVLRDVDWAMVADHYQAKALDRRANA